ncbi:LamB/YcsF family protein, partial [Klebsiella pneumoniae]|nr:LamB/YcsF family protein [Klebsiella pneumoniae]
LGVISEVFADRRYLPDGTLVPRSRPDAQVDSDEEAIAQVLQMVRDGQVKAVDGSLVAVQADSICLHGDGPHAVVFAEKIRQELLA